MSPHLYNRPDIYHLPSTNAQTTTGDGIKMAKAIGAELIHMDMVQVHPTGLVDPKDPDSKWKVKKKKKRAKKLFDF